MSYLALIPTHQLPGWPEVTAPSLLDSFIVILGIPLAIVLVFTLFIMGPHWLRRSQGKEIERA